QPYGRKGVLQLVREALRDVLPCIDLFLSQLVGSRAFNLPEHPVEGCDEPARLVSGLYDEPHSEVPGSDAAGRLLEAHERLRDEIGRGDAEERGDEEEGKNEEAVQ